MLDTVYSNHLSYVYSDLLFSTLPPPLPLPLLSSLALHHSHPQTHHGVTILPAHLAKSMQSANPGTHVNRAYNISIGLIKHPHPQPRPCTHVPNPSSQTPHKLLTPQCSAAHCIALHGMAWHGYIHAAPNLNALIPVPSIPTTAGANRQTTYNHGYMYCAM
ncbi:hypothetical protein J1614_005645 [Plenodomus biglobosus]|nr:hypothetical protein J1614_005645 [Plenodomus biglobosus]